MSTEAKQAVTNLVTINADLTRENIANLRAQIESLESEKSKADAPSVVNTGSVADSRESALDSLYFRLDSLQRRAALLDECQAWVEECTE